MQEESIFAGALAKASPLERAAFLAEACAGDQALRARVEALLDAHEHPDSFLEPPGRTLSILSALQHAGSTRQRYTLTRLHAKGGIGQVWLAHDSALGRDVALKELRSEHADRPAVWVRFLEEAQITGQLEHPGIVPVYELARPAEGQSAFYTMRFVRGRTLSEASREYRRRRQAGQAGRLELRELLGAFVAVCNTVAYAHSRHVLHRDLKGQNIILGRYGEVIVLDWGLAKIAGQDSPAGSKADQPHASLLPVALDKSDSRDETVQGQVLGTPGYMAPEQAAGRLDAIDQRTDVYGLGAILYEILCGRAPFIGDDTQDILKRVTQEPPEPPRRLVAMTPRALEAICLKALAKKPEERYASAAALARDVAHWLADEPVTAYAEPYWLRGLRWGRQHKAWVASAAVLVLAALLVLTVGTVLLGRANRLTEEQRDEARRQRDLAQENFTVARQAVDTYLTQVSDELLDQPRMGPVRLKLLRSALQYYETFVKQHRDDRTLVVELADAYRRVGEITTQVDSNQKAQAPLEKAIALLEPISQARPDDLGVQRALGHTYELLCWAEVYGGTWSKVEQTAAKAVSLLRQVRASYPQDREVRRRLGHCYDLWSVGRSRQGAFREALATSNQAIPILEQVCAESPEDIETLLLLGLAYNNRAVAEMFLTDRDGQKNDLLRAIATIHRLLKKLPTSLRGRRELALLTAHLGNLNYDIGHLHEAEATIGQAKQMFSGILLLDPELTDSRRYFALTVGRLAEVKVAQGQLARAQALYREAVHLGEDQAHRESQDPNSQIGLAWWYYRVGELDGQIGQWERGIRSCEKAQRMQARLVAEHPHAGNYKSDWLWCREELSWLRVRSGVTTAAVQIEPQLQIVREREQLAAGDPANKDWQFETAEAYVRVAELQLEASAPAAARPSAEHAVRLLAKLVDGSPKHFTYKRLFARACAVQARVEGELHDLTSATRSIQRAVSAAESLAHADDAYWYDLACYRALASALLADAKPPKAAEADTLASAALDALRRAIAAGYDNRYKLQHDLCFASVRSRPEFAQSLTATSANRSKAKP